MFRKKKKNQSRKTYLLNDESSFAVQEAYKTLRTNLIFSTPAEPCKKLIVTSAVRGEGKSTTAINLAIAFAQNKSKVLLMDCDLRLPTIGKKLKLKNDPGLTDALVGVNGLHMEIYGLSSGIHVLPAGTIPPNPTELLGSEQMTDILKRLSENYEYIIMDTPPVNEVADAAILSKNALGVVMVVRQGVSTTKDVDVALDRLQFADAKVLGFVLNGVENKKKKGYRKGYGYGYGYGYKARQPEATEPVEEQDEGH